MLPSEPAHLLAEPPATPVVPEYVIALEKAAAYLPADQLVLLRKAWTVGAAAHVGPTRRSGAPDITHPGAVATVLADERRPERDNGGGPASSPRNAWKNRCAVAGNETATNSEVQCSIADENALDKKAKKQ